MLGGPGRRGPRRRGGRGADVSRRDWAAALYSSRGPGAAPRSVPASPARRASEQASGRTGGRGPTSERAARGWGGPGRRGGRAQGAADVEAAEGEGPGCRGPHPSPRLRPPPAGVLLTARGGAGPGPGPALSLLCAWPWRGGARTNFPKSRGAAGPFLAASWAPPPPPWASVGRPRGRGRTAGEGRPTCAQVADVSGAGPPLPPPRGGAPSPSSGCSAGGGSVCSRGGGPWEAGGVLPPRWRRGGGLGAGRAAGSPQHLHLPRGARARLRVRGWRKLLSLGLECNLDKPQGRG